MRTKLGFVVASLSLIFLSPSNGFQPPSAWQERPSPLGVVGSSTQSVGESSHNGSTSEETTPALSNSVATTTPKEGRALAATLETASHPLQTGLQKFKNRCGSAVTSLVRKYAVTLVCLASMALGAWLTRNLALTCQAWRIRRNILAGCIIFTVGDVGAQMLTHWSIRRRSRRQQKEQSTDNSDKTAAISLLPLSFSLDQQRLAISTILGAIWAGIWVPYIYDSVERLLPGHQGVGRILLKMALSCSFLSTAGNYITMFFRRFVGHLCDFVADQWRVQEKSNPDASSWWPAVQTRWMLCVASCNRDFYEVLLDDLKIWPLYDILCYAVIPPFIRPVTTALMSSAWSMYMSIVSAAVGKDQEEEELAQRSLSGNGENTLTGDSSSLVAPTGDEVRQTDANATGECESC